MTSDIVLGTYALCDHDFFSTASSARKKLFVEKTLGAEEIILRYIRIVCYSIRQHSKPIRILSEVMPGGNILTAPVMQAENDLS